MNISENMKELFERQISHEMHNHQVYRYFGNRLSNIGLNKIGAFMKSQSNGELEHHEKLVKYCEQRNVDIDFVPVESVSLSYNTILDIAQEVLKLEQKTTSMLKEMAMTAWNEGDLLTYEWLMSDLIKEQIEEISVVQTLVDNLTNIGDSMIMIQLYDNTFPL